MTDKAKQVSDARLHKERNIQDAKDSLKLVKDEEYRKNLIAALERAEMDLFALAYLEARTEEGWNTNMEEAKDKGWVFLKSPIINRRGKKSAGFAVYIGKYDPIYADGCWFYYPGDNRNNNPTAWREITPPSDEMLEKWMGE